MAVVMLGKLAIVLLLLLDTGSGLQWSEKLRAENSPVHVCSGQNIQLLWNFTLDEGERLKGIVWGCQPEGRKDDVLATYMDDHFVPMSSFSGRLAHLQTGAVELSCATILESGNYSVAVTIEKAPNSLTVYRNTASVLVLDTPKSPEDKIRVSVGREAVFDATTGSWYVELLCGNISDLGHPPVDVLWTTPSGKLLNSTSYKEGIFHLLVPNPPEGGQYNCSIPRAPHPAMTCLPSDSALLETASAVVMETSARFLLLEARQQQIEQWVQEQRTSWTDFSRDVVNRTVDLEQWRDAAQVEFQAKPVNFHATLANDHDGSSQPWAHVLILDNVAHNVGQCYNPVNGFFTAQTSGTYFFIATAETLDSNHRGNLQIKRRLGLVAKIGLETSGSNYYGSLSKSSSGQVILSLTAGEQVWLECESSCRLRNTVTSFSGFRI